MRIPRSPSFLSVARTIALAAALAGCAPATAPSPESEVARKRWDEHGPSDYRVTIQRSCECLPEMSGPVRVEVRGGAVAARTYVASGEAVSPELAALFPDVPGLFEIVADARRRRAPRMSVTYDAVLGYPTRISVDYDATSTDDEVVYQATGLEPL